MTLYKNGTPKQCLVHRLVAEAFIDNLGNKAQINHIDGNKQNNKIDNLEWCTSSENNKHAHATGLNKFSEKHRKLCIELGKKIRREKRKESCSM